MPDIFDTIDNLAGSMSADLDIRHRNLSAFTPDELEREADLITRLMESLDAAKSRLKAAVDKIDDAKADAMQRIADEHLRSVAPQLLKALEVIYSDVYRGDARRISDVAADAIALARDVPAFA